MSRLDRRTMLKTTAMATLAPAISTWSDATAWAQEAALADLPTKDAPYADGKLVDQDPPAIGEGSFSIAVFPDTQNYQGRNAEKFGQQATWVVENKEKYNIACVLHLGDITNNNRPEQWENAQKSMQLLDGKVPYFMAPGNHDYSEGGSCKDRTTLFSEYFPVEKYSQTENFGGVYDKEPDRIENSFHRFAAGGVDYIVMALEFGPRKEVVAWASDVLKQHPDHHGILITHAYMYYNDDRYNWKRHGTKQTWNPHSYGVAKATNDNVCDGEELWNRLVKKHPHMFMTLNGHVLGDGLGRTTSRNNASKAVHQMLVNFQMRPNGGDGWMRLIEVAKPSKQLKVIDYSPVLGQCNVAPENHFELKLS